PASRETPRFDLLRSLNDRDGRTRPSGGQLSLAGTPPSHRVEPALDERQALRVTPSLYPLLQAKCFIYPIELTEPDESDRQAARGVHAVHPLRVRGKSSIQITRAPNIEGPIGAAEDVRVSSHRARVCRRRRRSTVSCRMLWMSPSRRTVVQDECDSARSARSTGGAHAGH